MTSTTDHAPDGPPSKPIGSKTTGTAVILLLLGWGCRSAAESVEPRTPGTEDAAPLNVLFIAVDDLRPELGCYGVEASDSPHMDAFAETACLFEQHFVQAPSCGPSRYALLTGRSPHRSGALSNESLYRGRARLGPATPGAAQSFPERLRQGGYRTICIGKISHTPDGRVFAYDGTGSGEPELPGAWDELATPFGPWKRGWGAFFAYGGGRHREDGSGHRDLFEFEASSDGELPDGWIAEAAAAKLHKLKGREEPFLMGVGFYKPHLPFVATAKDRAAVETLDVIGPTAADRWDSPYARQSGEIIRYEAPFPMDRGGARVMAPEAALETKRAYLACVRYVDRQVGVVLDALEEAGLAESTIVVLWGDHGWHLGESGLWGKHTLLDRSLRSALMVRAPGITRAGSRTSALAASIDLFPTLMELCGLGQAQTMHPLDGVSLVPLLNGSAPSVRHQVTSYWGKSATVRTDSHRLLATRAGDAWTKAALFTTAAPDPTARTRVIDETIARVLLDRLPPLEPRSISERP